MWITAYDVVGAGFCAQRMALTRIGLLEWRRGPDTRNSLRMGWQALHNTAGAFDPRSKISISTQRRKSMTTEGTEKASIPALRAAVYRVSCESPLLLLCGAMCRWL
jgi:hypothetical protein